MTLTNIEKLIHSLCSQSKESEWLEFKYNLEDQEEIGEYISALSNSAALHSKPVAYMVWGIEDQSHKVLGTTFNPKMMKAGNKQKNSNQELESWLLQHMNPQIEFQFTEGVVEGQRVVVLEIQPARTYPVRFKSTAFIRVGTYKKKLYQYPEKERLLWKLLGSNTFEQALCKQRLSGEQVLAVLDYGSYFKLLDESVPTSQAAILQKLSADQLILQNESGDYSITNLGGVLFANDLKLIPSLKRKALRVIKYKGANRVETVKEHCFSKGYAVIFEDAVDYINAWLPSNEEIQTALRNDVRVYPEIAIRELVANALIHQNFDISGVGPMVEIFENRLEITNPGSPLVNILRFIDEPPISRNEDLAALMRRMHICEERGSGIDKVIFQVELFQLPPPDFRATESSTIAVLFCPKRINELGKEEKVRACYQHACLQWVSGTQMSNATLRKRLGIKDKSYPLASRIIKDSIDAQLLKPYGDAAAKKTARYVPFWA